MHSGVASGEDRVRRSLDEVTTLIREILGPDAGIAAAAIGPETRLEADLQLESIDLVTLDELLRQRYGDEVALCDHVARLEFEAILGLTVRDVATYVARARP